MPIQSTSSNYQGRKVDLSVFPQSASPGVPVPLEFSVTPKAIAGPAKAAQNFFRILLTPLGHYRSDAEFGSNFWPGLIGGTIRYPSDLQHLFVAETERVLRYLRTHYKDDVPLDERVGKVTLLTYTSSRTKISLSLSVAMEDGGNYSYLLPVSWNP